MWLKLTPINNNPKVILRFYLEAVGELEGVFTVFYHHPNLRVLSKLLKLWKMYKYYWSTEAKWSKQPS